MDKKYINGQGLLPYKNIKYMGSSIGKAGCGPIATYNILCILNNEKKLDEIIAYYSNHKIINLNGLIGTNIFCMILYLRKLSYKCKLYFIPSLKAIDKILRSERHGIIMYFHARGSHFICTEYNKYENDEFTIYNKSNYSKSEYTCTSIKKLKSKGKLFIPIFLLTVNAK